MNPGYPITRLALGALFLAAAGSPALGQDDALKKLLEKLEPQAPAAKADDKKADDKKADDKKADDKKADDKKADGDKAKGKTTEADERDKAVDSFLEKLGGGLDESPEAQGNAPREIGPDADLPGQKPIGQGDQGLDEHLERLIGRIKKETDQEKEGGQEGGEGQSPEGGRMAETVKKMRDVEQRLTKLDTGEDTRKTQEQIVGDLDQLLNRVQQMRQQQQRQRSQQQGAKMAGQQQGQQPGQDPGDQGGGAPPAAPRKPDPAAGLAGAKDSWGHLPGTLREVMENVSRMQPLPEKKDLIERYFLSVAKRSLSRSGGE